MCKASSAKGDPSQPASSRPKILIVDRARDLRCDEDRRFSDRLATAFGRDGFDVIWIAGDPTSAPHDATGISLLTVRRIEPGAEAFVQSSGSAGGGTAQGENSLVANLDYWARITWKRRSNPLSAAGALIVWILIRAYYIANRADSPIIRFFLRVARRAFHLSIRIVRRVYVRLLSLLPRPVLRMLGSAANHMPSRTGISQHAADSPSELTHWIRALGPRDIVVFPSAELVDLEDLLRLVPNLGSPNPIAATLHMRFAAADRITINSGDVDRTTLGVRLKTGCPIRTVVLHADTRDRCRDLALMLKLPVFECGRNPDAVEIHSRFAAIPASKSRSERGVTPSLVLDRFGPVALLISALWGRVGSTTIFDAQTRYLVERGCLVVRIFIDHYPHYGTDRANRIRTALAENFEQARPHLYFVAERIESLIHLARLNATPGFLEGSPVKRISMLLADATIENRAEAAWCADRAAVAVVNHLPHVEFAEALTSAPIVLETHDIYASLITSHGIPAFVPVGNDGKEVRDREEIEVWRRVAACINLSPQDHDTIAREAKRSALIRPYVRQAEFQLRDWADVIAANKLPEHYASKDHFDIMIWGDWHGGNIAGVQWFIEEVVERNARLRTASILLAGRVIRGLPPSLLARDHLHAVGFVDHIDDFMARSSVLVIPDRPGSTGLSIKAIDALARGLCFSSTSAGLRGISLEDSGLEPAIDDITLAADITSLLDSQEARVERATIARRIYERNFSQAAYSKGWDTIIDPILSEFQLQVSKSAERDDPKPDFRGADRAATSKQPELQDVKRS